MILECTLILSDHFKKLPIIYVKSLISRTQSYIRFILYVLFINTSKFQQIFFKKNKIYYYCKTNNFFFLYKKQKLSFIKI